RVLAYKFSEYLDTKDIENAEKTLEKLFELEPENSEWMVMRLELSVAKKLPEKMMQLVNEGYEKYPRNWSLAYTAALLAAKSTRNFDRAVEILEDFCSRKLTVEGLYNLSLLYLEMGDKESWEQTIKRLIAYKPSAPGYHFQLARVYFQLQEYDLAKKAVLDAIDICPNNSTFWESLGDVERVLESKDQSRIAYEKALAFNPQNFQARDSLRELLGKPYIFSHFDSADIMKLVKDSPDGEDYPEDKAVFLLNDTKRVVYENGASEIRKEILVKVFNNAGIDLFKEYIVPYNYMHQTLTIEKAVVIKQDNTEVNADRNDSIVVYKSLEPNDVIHLKWKIRDFYSGKLCNHFWEEIYFNSVFPVTDSRFALLVPPDYKFYYQAQNMSEKPNSKKKTEDGLLYQWRLTNQDALAKEVGRPGLNDVGKMLFLSSVNKWEFFVNWYLDIAMTKTKSSYQIKSLVKKLLKSDKELNNMEKARRLYNYIIENINYSSISFRQSAFVPQKARDVLNTRLGDCKDVTTLYIAMLNEAGITAHYVLLNTRDYGLNKNILPSIAFNHAIAAVEIDDTILYTDLTASNFPMGSLPRNDLGAFMLRVKPGVTTTELLPEKNLIPGVRSYVSLVKFSGNDAEIQKKASRTGSTAGYFRNIHRYLGKKDRDQRLKGSISDEHQIVTLERFDLFEIETNTEEVRYEYDYKVTDFLAETGSFKTFKIPWGIGFNSRDGLSYEKREFPYRYIVGYDNYTEDMTIKLPEGFEPVELPESITMNNPIIDFTYKISFKDGIISAQWNMVNKKSIVSPDEYVDFKNFYNTVFKINRMQILLKKIK
ncbi:DUF3857 domain-containing protein, partial [bacterium]|nr:DUF3857 domain-containing protein [bacterium]